MFPEYRDLITHLKSSHTRFALLFQKHNALDKEIAHMESTSPHTLHDEIAHKKKEKLHTKDLMLVILQEEDARRG